VFASQNFWSRGLVLPVLRFEEKGMATPKEMDVVRRAYELWQQAGEPSGKDEEFYHQAKKELQEALDKNNPTRAE
jgi:Protein of unknown function (DUF2934)